MTMMRPLQMSATSATVTHAISAGALGLLDAPRYHENSDRNKPMSRQTGRLDVTAVLADEECPCPSQATLQQ